jgi:hypothetical protein
MRYPLYYRQKSKNRFIFYTLIFGATIAAAHVHNLYTAPLQLNKGCVVILCLVPVPPTYLIIAGNIFSVGFYICTILFAIELFKFKQRFNNNNATAAMKEENENMKRVI